MVVRFSALAGFLLLAPIASAQETQIVMRPGAYAAAYDCPRIRISGQFDLYVFDELETSEGMTGSAPRQRVRVVVGDAIYTATATRDRSGNVYIAEHTRERRAEQGWDEVPRYITLVGRPEALNGTTTVTRSVHFQCEVRARRGAPARTFAEMSYPRLGFEDNHDEHRGHVQRDTPVFTPTQASARSMSAAITRAVTADAESWMADELVANTLRDFHFFQRHEDLTTVLAWTSYKYLGLGGELDGWVVTRFRNGELDCIQYHNRNSCTRPRQSYAAQVEALGQGRARLGPVAVPNANCFVTRTRTETRSREVVVGREPGRSSDVITRTEYYSVPVEETIYTCASQSYELECVAGSGTDRLTEWLIGQGTTRDRVLTLTNGQPTGWTRADIANLNSRIQNGTCVRTR